MKKRGCKTNTFKQQRSQISFDWIVKEAFAENQIITITTSKQGDYLYQLDSGTPQISPVFENSTQGIHTITVIDSNGYSDPITRNDIVVINYPKFFTPNNDGYNDSWSIPELFYDPNAFIQIYDRYGKLLKILNLKNSEVWDGMYNENVMPSTDHWFVVNYSVLNIPQTFKAHFSLKR
jgi:gliding motility-associated-like protein